MRGFTSAIRELTRYPSALLGLVIIAGLISLAVYAVISLPYNEAIRLWRGGESVWIDHPRNAQPRLDSGSRADRRRRVVVGVVFRWWRHSKAATTCTC